MMKNFVSGSAGRRSWAVASEDSAEKRQCSGTRAEESLPVKTVKCYPGVMVYCS
jgi:hypothetical protein